MGRTTPAGTAAEFAEAILYAFLVSPSFIALPETDTTTPSGTGFQLSSYEVAQRLSYMLWGSIPDDMLTAAADGNQLQTKAQILTQAQRMIAVRDKTTPIVQLFHRQWVQMNNASAHWWNGDNDMTKFPLYNATTSKTSYAAEIDSFFAEVVFTQRRLQGPLPEPRRLHQQGQRRHLRHDEHRDHADQGQSRSGAASGLHDARRVLELIRALRLDGSDPARRVHHRSS